MNCVEDVNEVEINVILPHWGQWMQIHLGFSQGNIKAKIPNVLEKTKQKQINQFKNSNLRQDHFKG